MTRKTKTPACCPTCKRPLPPDGLQLSPIKRRILDLVARSGEIPANVLHTALWGSDPNGGPEMKTLHEHIWQLNRLLAPHGLAVSAGRGGGRAGGKPYRLIAEAVE